MRPALLVLLLSLAVACAPPPAASPPPPFDRPAAVEEVVRELDDLHDAAARSEGARYFAHYAKGAVFLGTDATERWDLAAFHAYADARFANGKGWVFRVVRRAVELSEDGGVAWFDEDLAGERLGPARGSGVLVRGAGRWLIVQYNLAVTVPNDRFDAVRAAADAAPPPRDLHARHRDAYRDATEAAARGDLARAGALLSALVPEAKTHPDDDLEFWLHNELTWVRWAAGDAAAARAEVEQAKATLDHALLPADRLRALRLHELWDRAYLALEEALSAPPSARKARMAAADAARAEYDALGKAANDHDGMAVLGAFFATGKRDVRRAAAEASKVDPAKDTDLQDLYVIALALDAAGDRPGSERVSRLICAGKESLMKPLILRAMAGKGSPWSPCPR